MREPTSFIEGLSLVNGMVASHRYRATFYYVGLIRLDWALAGCFDLGKSIFTNTHPEIDPETSSSPFLIKIGSFSLQVRDISKNKKEIDNKYAASLEITI